MESGGSWSQAAHGRRVKVEGWGLGLRLGSTLALPVASYGALDKSLCVSEPLFGKCEENV